MNAAHTTPRPVWSPALSGTVAALAVSAPGSALAQVLPPQVIVTFGPAPVAVPLGPSQLFIALGVMLLALVLARMGKLRGSGALQCMAALAVAAGLLGMDTVRAQLPQQTLDLLRSPATLQIQPGQNNSVLVRNKTGHPVVLRSIGLGDDSANEYSITTTICKPGLRLQNEASCAVEVTYTTSGGGGGTGGGGGGGGGSGGFIDNPQGPDDFADRAQALADGDSRLPPSTPEQLEQSFKTDKPPGSAARSQRLRRNHSMVLAAVDPEPRWHKTQISTSFIVAEPGGSYAVELARIDPAGQSLGPLRKADQVRLRFELRVQQGSGTVDYVPAHTHKDYLRWDDTNPGRLRIGVPAGMQKGRLLIGIRPDLGDKGQNAIAERWSVPLVVEVWPRRAVVRPIEVGRILYPARFSEGIQPSPGSAFSMPEIAEHLRQAYAALPGAVLLKPLVVAGAGLAEGQLVDARIPHPEGGSYPYGGRVLRVVEGSGGQQLAILDFDLAATYELLPGDPLVREGVMPEFVTYRQGPSQQAPGDMSEPELEYFGPEERSGIKAREAWQDGNVLAQAKISVAPSCNASGSMSLTFTPILQISPQVDVGIEYTVAANGTKVECSAKIDGATDIVSSLSTGLPLARLASLVGIKLEAGPYGEAKIGLTPKSDTGVAVFFSQTGQVSYRDGMASPQVQMSSGDAASGKGLDGAPWGLDVGLGSGVGVGVALKLEPFSLFGGTFQVVSLEAKAELGMGTAVDNRNAAAVKQWSDASNASFSLKPEASVLASSGFVDFLSFLGLKAEVGAGVSLKLIDSKVEANYAIQEVKDAGDGTGSVSFKELTLPSVLKSIFAGSTAGYASLQNSSVYNDPTGNITYELDECDTRGGTISTPLVACKGGLFCGKADRNADFCKATWVSPVMASAYVGDTASTTGTAGTRGLASVNASLAGSPLRPAPAVLTLPGGGHQSFIASAACTARGVTQGKIQLSVGGKVADKQPNTLVCNCKPGSKDCDRTWASPHLVTADGLAYDYVASGDYILARVHDADEEPVHGFEVQSRFLPGYDVSWPQAAAMQVGNDVVEVRAVPFAPAEMEWAGYANTLELHVNGQLLASLSDDGFWNGLRRTRVQNLPSGGLVYFDDFAGRGGGAYWVPRAVTVLWPQNGPFAEYAVKLSTPYFEQGTAKADSFSLMEVQIIRPAAAQGAARGMLGNNDGSPGNDLIRRNGEVLAHGSTLSWTALYALFGGDWLVKPQECLFGSGCMAQPSFPEKAVVLSDKQRKLGEIACAGLTGYYREACIHDVGLSGSIELVKDYYANTADLNAMADKLVTPGVDLPMYVLSSMGASARLPDYPGKGFRQAYQVTHQNGEGQFMLTIRPPRGTSAFFSAGGAGALKQNLAATDGLEVSVDVQCETPDPAWAKLGDSWARRGAVQLWAVDPLSGFASRLLGEKSIFCGDAGQGSRLVAGEAHSLILNSEGKLWAWGSNSFGQLGDGTSTDRNRPVQADLAPLGGSKVVALATRTSHTLALDDQSRLWAWGENFYGQLGDGTSAGRNRPVQVDLAPLDGSEIVAVAAGDYQTAALDEQGRIWVWGLDDVVSVDDNTIAKRTRPVQVDLTPLDGSKVVALAAGYFHTLALDEQGHLWAWGWNSDGELGDGTNADRNRPVQVDLAPLDGSKVVEVAAGGFHTLARDEQGRLWAWGQNSGGQLGDGTTIDRNRPVRVDLAPLDGSKVVALAANTNHTVALDERGRLWAWGFNHDGTLGDGTTVARNRPVQVDLAPLDGSKVVAFAAGTHHTLALDEQGHLWAWGLNSSGELGDGTTVRRNRPVQVDLAPLKP
ncbi:alpha-tubulin suppressor-like RCC1 family protein [Delftia acidovorans]|uniref:RCC1 domain-containing protein n=1 Tax=Delftia acidovorans TaxID=80866 RepID=UPI000FA23D50|nr:RCC1 domain-containing protein [Delftia acidovorans]ROR04058.1 alpha-tubulin suppressor-like RCC1 family protein [Delftia acidovorans]